jgi:hypothetical protein
MARGERKKVSRWPGRQHLEGDFPPARLPRLVQHHPATIRYRNHTSTSTRRISVSFRRNPRTGSPIAAINTTPIMIPAVSRRVCIAPSETSKVVARAAACPALRRRVTRVVSAAEMATGPYAPCRDDARCDHVWCCPRIQQVHGHKAGAQAVQVSHNYVVGPDARQLRLFHQLVSGRTQTCKNQRLVRSPTDCSQRKHQTTLSQRCPQQIGTILQNCTSRCFLLSRISRKSIRLRIPTCIRLLGEKTDNKDTSLTKCARYIVGSSNDLRCSEEISGLFLEVND